MISLRPYQREACEAIEKEWQEGRKRTLLVLPTGTGKTICFANVAQTRVKAGDRVLILAHRDELLEQARAKILSATGIYAAKEKADETSLGSFAPIVVGSVQTLMGEKRLSRFPSDEFQTVIIDEAHHALASSYQKVLQHFDGAKVLGVTATPDRGDRKNLGEYFQSLAYEYSIHRAMKEHYLCRIVAQTIPLDIDISGVHMSSGDYAAKELGSALDPYLEQIATEMETYCQGRKTVVFLPLVYTSQKFRNILERHGFRAAEVNGNSQDREQVLADFEAGKYDVLCNSMLLTEGWDCPSVDCVIVLRPTKVRSLYCQMVGRGTRLSPETGKQDLLLLDFLWNTERLDLCHPASLICSDEKIAQRMTEKLKEGGAADIEEAASAAEKDVIQERENSLKEQLAEMKNRKRKLVDPIQYALSVQAEDLAGYEPTFPWEMAPASKKQLTALEHYGIFPDEIQNCGMASLLLDRIHARIDEGLTTPKQIRFLEQKGFQHVGTWQFGEASRLISAIAANGWRVPYHIKASTYQPESVKS